MAWRFLLTTGTLLPAVSATGELVEHRISMNRISRRAAVVHLLAHLAPHTDDRPRCIENPGGIMSGRLLPMRTQRPCPGPRLGWNRKSLPSERLKRPIRITAPCPMWQRNRHRKYKCNALLILAERLPKFQIQKLPFRRNYYRWE